MQDFLRSDRHSCAGPRPSNHLIYLPRSGNLRVWSEHLAHPSSVSAEPSLGKAFLYSTNNADRADDSQSTAKRGI
jgi:hypothetical protein